VAPTNLAATANSANQVTLTWVDSSNNETGFRVEFLTGGAWVQLSTLAANVSSCVVSGLTTHSSYSFRISSFNVAGSSTSNPVNITTP
jgi:titin